MEIETLREKLEAAVAFAAFEVRDAALCARVERNAAAALLQSGILKFDVSAQWDEEGVFVDVVLPAPRPLARSIVLRVRSS